MVIVYARAVARALKENRPRPNPDDIWDTAACTQWNCDVRAIADSLRSADPGFFDYEGFIHYCGGLIRSEEYEGEPPPEIS